MMYSQNERMALEEITQTRVNVGNIKLHFDDHGTLWVVNDVDTIFHLDYASVENYHACDFNVDLEALMEYYYKMNHNKVAQRYRAAQIIRNLRKDCYTYKILKYARQLARVVTL